MAASGSLQRLQMALWVQHIKKHFSDHLQDRYSRFNDRYLNDEKDLAIQLYKETELVMINNR